MGEILLLIAHEGFQSKEYHDTRDALERAGHKVVVGSDKEGLAHANTGEEVTVDHVTSTVHALDFDGVFVIGGPGALVHLDNDETVRIMREAKEQGHMPYGAICIAPRILIKAGLVRGLRVTGWDKDGKLETICENGGAMREARPVVVDGRVITGSGPEAAAEFGEAIGAALASQ